MKYAIGIVTCDRPEFCKNLLDSLPQLDNVFVENTGNNLFVHKDVEIHKFQTKTPVVFGKNALFRRILAETDAEYIFILEDDIVISDKTVFDKYIETSEKTGIQHMNFGFSQKENLDENGNPLYKKIVDYPNGAKIVLTHNILGAFSMYTRECLEKVGIMNELYNENSFEHVEFTHRIALAGFAGYFWNFEDVYGSWDMISNQGTFNDTTIRHDPMYIQAMRRALVTFHKQYGYNLLEIFHVDEQTVLNKLRVIYSTKRSVTT
jgi:hypothetical protein